MNKDTPRKRTCRGMCDYPTLCTTKNLISRLLTSTSSEVVPFTRPVTSTTFPRVLAPRIDSSLSGPGPVASFRAFTAPPKFILGGASLDGASKRSDKVFPGSVPWWYMSCFHGELISPFGGRVYGAEPARRAFERTGPTPPAGSTFMRSKRDVMAKLPLQHP